MQASSGSCCLTEGPHMKWSEWLDLLKLAGEFVLGSIGLLVLGLIGFLAYDGGMSLYDKLPHLQLVAN